MALVDLSYISSPNTLYTNSGGTGDRLASITATTDLSVRESAVTTLVDGLFPAPFNGFRCWQQDTVGLYMRFDFGAGESKVITEAKWYSDSTGATDGTWRWQGSDDASSWTNIGSTFTLSGSTEQTQTELSGNANGYRYYQLLGVSGQVSGLWYWREVEFKIDDASATLYAPGWQAYQTDGSTVQWMCLQSEGGNVGVGVEQPTAKLHLPAGTAAASSAPLKLNTGTSLTTAEAGAFEFTTDDLYFTITTGAARKEIALTEGLSSGRVPFATTNGRLTDAAGLAWNGSLLVATGFSGGGVTTGEDPGHTHTGASLSDIDIAEAEATENIAAGLPVYGVAGSATAGLARADTTAKSRVVGLAIAAAASGHTVTYAFGGMLELADWTAVGGSAALTVNSIYYLAETGGITKTPISTTGQYLVELGIAVETTVLLLNIKRPIYL